MTSELALPYPRVDPDHVRATAARLASVAERASAGADALRSQAASLESRWEGPGAVACAAELHASERLTLRACLPLRGAAVVLLRYVQAIVEARQLIDSLRRDYAEEQLRHRYDLARVTGQLELAGAARKVVIELLQVDQQQHRSTYLQRHAQILAEVRTAAQLAGRRLHQLAAEAVPGGLPADASPTDQEHAFTATLPWLFAQRSLFLPPNELPPPDMSAKQVRGWWGLLSRDEQQRLIQAQPGAIGRLDGLPAAARSSANEILLRERIGDLVRRPQLGDLARRELTNCLIISRQLRRLRRTTDPVSGLPVTVDLVIFEPAAFAGEGRAALVVGELDTADNVAYLVPGTGSDVQKSWRALTGDAARVGQLSRERQPGNTTAVVAWMGYDSPTATTVWDDKHAQHGGDLLIRDVRAAQAARETGPHLTVVGHSYGSVTVGEALKQGLPGVSDAVLIGSPGVGVEHARELQLEDGHVFVGSSSRDLVTYLDWFGKDPSHESFGGVRFRAEHASRHEHVLNFGDHSKYYWAGSDSLSSIVNVVTSDYANVVIADYRVEHGGMPDGIGADPETSRRLAPGRR